MVIDFSRLDLKENPVLILKNTDGAAVGTVGLAYNIILEPKYNETSMLEFTVPKTYTDKDGNVENTPYYDLLTGMRVFELDGIGQFVMTNPSEQGDGVKQYKLCKAYSLEYEFTYKQITISNGTYNLWNPAAPDGTLLGIVLEKMTGWSVGSVDTSLIGKYRTFEVSGENIYNFLKGTAQKSYNCIFDFDTLNRKINVKDVSGRVVTNPVYISRQNLATDIKVEEDTESIVTKIGVYGAEGVDIRDVNPGGNNNIINLDYYMTEGNFTSELIRKYFEWKELYKNSQKPYYNLSTEYTLQTMHSVAAKAALTDLEGELTNLENQQAVTIQAIAMNLTGQDALDEINVQIKEKQSEIADKKAEIEAVTEKLEEILDEMKVVNDRVSFDKYFTEQEYALMDRYIKEGTVEESSFVYNEVSFNGSDVSEKLSSVNISVSGAEIEKLTSLAGDDIYTIVGGSIKAGDNISGGVISGSFEINADKTVLFTAYLEKGTVNGEEYPTGCMSVTGGFVSVSDSETALSFEASDAYMYFTYDTNEYVKNAVSWDLYEYGEDVLERMSKPSYTFSVTSANFISLDTFKEFKNNIKLGEKIYVGISEDETLAPIVIGARMEWDNPQALTLQFSDKYVSGDSAFELADLLNQSVSMGKSVDTSKFTYSAFVDSGASTNVKEFITSSLDVAKNAILSSNNQAISWDDAGIRLRKWADSAHTQYEVEQTWLNNNSIMMTRNNWETAELAIGKFYDKNLGDQYGIVAPAIVGTILAGNNLVIESEKTDGTNAVFRVDGDGCFLHNSCINIVSGDRNTHISLDPDFGIVIGEYPVYTVQENTRSVTGTKIVDEDRAKFWVDTEGNLHFKGTLEAADGYFSGKIVAKEGEIAGWTISDVALYNGKDSFSSTKSGIYIGTDGIAIKGSDGSITMSNTGLLTADNASITGTVNATAGNIGGCVITDNYLSIDGAHIQNGTIASAKISNLSASKITSGTLDCGNITVKNLNAESIVAGTITADKIVDGSITNSKLGDSSVSTGKIQNSAVTAAKTSNLSADKITTGTLSADRIDTNGLSAKDWTFSGSIYCYTLKAGYLNYGNYLLTANSSGVYITGAVYMNGVKGGSRSIAIVTPTGDSITLQFTNGIMVT